MDNVLSIRIYPDKHYVVNVVHPDDIENHIEYNKDFRPGCLLYVDGKRVSNGMRKEEYLADFDEYEKSIRTTELKSINMNKCTRPYR